MSTIFMVCRFMDAAHTTTPTHAAITVNANATRRLTKVKAATNALVTATVNSAFAHWPSYW